MIKVTNRDLSHELSEPNHFPKTLPIRGFIWYINKIFTIFKILNYNTGTPLRCSKDIHIIWAIQYCKMAFLIIKTSEFSRLISWLLKKSLGLEKKTMCLPGTYHPCPGDLSSPAQNLPPVQLQMPSQLKITQNIPPD